jgi:hypothetical protein
VSFYLFRLETIGISRKRGNIPDNDVITFTVMINQVDRGHGSGFFPAMVDDTVAYTYDITEDGLPAYPAKSRLNMSQDWQIGPLEVAPSDNIGVVYTGTNTSDSNLSSLGTQKQDELELKILDIVAKKFVGLFAGAGFGDDLGSAFSREFDKAFKDPVGELIGYQQQGPCNGPVFAGVVPFRGSDLDNLVVAPLTYNYFPGTPYPETRTSEYPGIRFTNHYTDASTHDTTVCGAAVAETDVTFSVCRLAYISVKTWTPRRFLSPSLDTGLRKLGKPNTTISVKSLLGVRP